MKLLYLTVLGLICVSLEVNSHVLGAKECTWGPSYWCQNITHAKLCGAVKHCIQTVWEHQKLPPDDDDVCKICLEMVKEARDQLESNETQEELKEVFEGSCNLIPVKVISEACCKVADEFIPELVETLASQMNPQVVCSVAGLCNNAWVDKQLEDSRQEGLIKATPLQEATEVNDCSGCKVVINALEKRMETMSRDELLNNMLRACGRVGSLSDGCSAIIITYFTEIYDFLQRNFKSGDVCHVAGVCSGTFHKHRPLLKNVEVVHESDIGVVKPKDDLPCEFCEQLVIHLRDVLIANTTEEEFEDILRGLCKQTRSFKDECLSIVNEYYAEIYEFLVKDLNAKETCQVFGLCTAPGVKGKQGPIWPLLPAQTAETLQASRLSVAQTSDRVKATVLSPAQPLGSIISATRMTSVSDKAAGFHRVPIGDNGGVVRVADVENEQLPFDRMLPQTVVYVNNKEECVFCQYFLHYVQQAITDPKTEAQIEKVVKEACDHLPDAIQGQCHEFVETYGNAFIALLAQEIDPSVICPQLGLCPSTEGSVALDATHVVNDKPTCPLCLLATQSIIEKLRNNKTEEEIRKELDILCDDLPRSIAGDCRDFVDKYEEQLVDMLIADFTPMEICTYLKLCDPIEKIKVTAPAPDILTNEIPQFPLKHKKNMRSKVAKVSVKDSTLCVVCEFALSKLDEELKDDATEEEIKGYVQNVCNILPRTVVSQCREFVEQYGDVVIALLAQSLDPRTICSEIKACSGSKLKHSVLIESVKKSVRECAVCEASMGAFDELLGDPNLQKDMEQLMKKVCPKLPAQDRAECNKLIDAYGPSIMNLISQVADPHLVCMEIGVCRWNKQTVHLLGGKKCVWGPGYWCQSVAHAKACGALDHCQERVWKAKKPMKRISN